MADLARRLRPRDADDAGISMVEMIVSVIIFGIVGAMLSTWFISTYKASTQATSRTDDLLSAQQAMDRVTRDIRMAIPITVGTAAIVSGSTGNDLTIYSNVGSDAAPRQIHWYVSGGTLIRSEVKGVKAANGTWSWPAASAIDTLTKGVVDDGNPDIFRYLDSTADNVPGLCTDLPKPATCATPLASPLSDANRLLTTSVEVTLRVAVRATSSGRPLQLRTRVYMPNAQLSASFK